MNHCKKLLVLAAVLGVALVACSQKKDVGQKAASPAAMKINGEVITAADLQRQLEESGMPPDSRNGITGKTMKVMINKELLRQAAIKEKLDADDKVRASIASTNRMILADANMQKQMAAIGKPTEAEVSAYFNQHPEFFAERKVYDLQEVAIKGASASEAAIKAKLASGVKLNDFLHWLDQQKIAHDAQQLSASSDRMRDDVVKKLKDARVGQAIIVDDTNQLVVVFMNSAQPQPVSLVDASPLIMKRLFNQKVGEGMENTLKKLHDQAKIEYVPPFTENGKGGDAEQ